MRLIDGSIRRPVTVFMATLGVVLFGLVAASRLSVDLLPDISQPTVNVSVVDLVAELGKPATVAAVNDAFRAAARGRLRGILDATDEELVSCDFNGNPHSSIVDLPSTALVEGNLIKVLAWYDNEWGYSSRVRDLIRFIAKTL